MRTRSGSAYQDQLYALWQQDYGYAQDLLESSDPQMRIDALDEFVTDGTGLVVLDRALANEDEAQVRVEMLHKVDESGSVLALNVLLKYLSDPDPAVITTAIQLIEEWGDDEVTDRYIQPLMQHADAGVREAATAAMDELR